MNRLRKTLMEMTSDDHLGTQELLEVPHDTRLNIFGSQFIKLDSCFYRIKKSTALLKNLSPERIQLTACGLFTVGKHLIPAVYNQLQFKLIIGTV